MTRALIRGDEVIIEPFSPWVIANMKWMTGTETDGEGNPIGGGDGWTLVENYEPPTEEDIETVYEEGLE